MVNPLARDLDDILTHTEGWWDEIRGKRIFITGGTRFFGCWLLESFAWANDKLNLDAAAIVLTRNAKAFCEKAPHLASYPAIEFRRGDVRSFEFPAGSFSHIIHAATDSSAKLNDENPLLMLDTIVQGTRHTLEFARRCGAKKFLLTSSGAVYGKQPPHLSHIPEDYAGGPDTVEPRSAYGEGKRLAEHLCAVYARQFGIETKIARCFAFVGPYLPLDIHYAIGNFIRDGLQGGPIRVNGDGTPYRSYLYAADLAIWLWTILFRGPSCRAYNVGSDNAMSITEVANSVAHVFGPDVCVEVKGVPDHVHKPNRYVPSVSRAENELGLRQRIGLIDAIEHTVRWHLARANTVTYG